MKRKLLILLFLLTLLGLWPFFKKGYFESHDGEWMVIRFSAFHQTLAGGQFPVRFVDRLNNNYGYPVLNFLYPLPFYLAEIPKLIGFGFVDSVKIIFVVSAIGSTLAMYWALSQIFDKRASLAGAIVYLFIPYRFADLYVRGSLGENLAFTFLPLIFGSIIKFSKGKKIFLPLISIFVAMLILSHNVIVSLFLPFFLVSSLLLIKKEKLKITSAFILGLLIASFFWIPAIFDLQFVRLSQIKVSDVSDHLVSPQKLFLPKWGYGPNPNGQDQLPVQVGVVAVFTFLTTLYLFISKQKRSDRLVNFMLIVFGGILFLMTKFSLPFWQNVPLVDVIQFPWRMLSLVVFIAAYLVAYLIDFSSKKNLLAALIILASIISTIVYTKPLSFVDRGDGFYSTNEDSTTVSDEYLPLWVQEKKAERAYRKVEVLEGDAEIENIQIKPANYRAKVNASEDSLLRVNTIYFPGWQVKSNGKVAPIDYQNKFGLINFKLPKGDHEVIINYAKTPVHLGSEVLTIVSILITGVLIYQRWPRPNS